MYLLYAAILDCLETFLGFLQSVSWFSCNGCNQFCGDLQKLPRLNQWYANILFSSTSSILPPELIIFFFFYSFLVPKKWIKLINCESCIVIIMISIIKNHIEFPYKMMELNVVAGNPFRESMYPYGRFSRLPEHSSHI